MLAAEADLDQLAATHGVAAHGVDPLGPVDWIVELPSRGHPERPCGRARTRSGFAGD
jgi:hypothetical protein